MSLASVWGSAADDVWTVGEGLVHWDGVFWMDAVSPTAARINDVWGLSANEVWAAGDSGTILRLRQ